MVAWIAIILSLLALGAVYGFFVRPILKQMQSLKGFYDTIEAQELTTWQKLQTFCSGLKIKMLSRLVYVPGLIVLIHDRVAAALPADVTPFISKIDPTWVFVANVVVGIAVDVARSYSDSPAAEG